jgi:L-fucose mutarotase
VLKNLDPLLNPDVLHALAAMGHGDEVVICDANFPADAVARHSVLGRLLRLDGVDSPRAVRAVLSVLPLDRFVDQARGYGCFVFKKGVLLAADVPHA